ncbi:MAG: putative polymerase [Pseudonocardiales bacterium]|nr:putative polymerase [Pseudonocardiales bacterium]
MSSEERARSGAPGDERLREERCDGVTESGRRLVDGLVRAGVKRGDPVALVISPAGRGSGPGAGLAVDGHTASLAADFADAIRTIEAQLRPRWVWWSNETATALLDRGIRPGTAWDLAAGHRILFGGWRADPARIWAALHHLATESMPGMGQLDLLGQAGDEGADPEEPVQPDGHLRAEWASGGWALTPARAVKWAQLAWSVAQLQLGELDALSVGGDPRATARSESAAELLCAELAIEGLPIDRAVAEKIIAASAGPRPLGDADAVRIRHERDRAVLDLVSGGDGIDLRSPAHVKQLLARVGIDVPDTRSWRLEPFRGSHPVVEALLKWRKAERVSTTYGYAWLDERVGSDGRLRGLWTASDGAAGRMTAQNGLHNLPAELRPAVVAEEGFVFVRADLGQIEPRVLAAVSGDPALIAATADPDLYAPVSARLRVERPIAKVAVLAAMYGQTSGVAGEALRGLEAAYPVAMGYLREAYENGRAGRGVRTNGGRLVRMPALSRDLDEVGERSALAGRGRFARNAVVQGAAAELFKAWAVTVRTRSASAMVPAARARIVLCLHDELLVHVRADEAPVMARIVSDGLQEAAHRWSRGGAARFVADISVIERWSDAKS